MRHILLRMASFCYLWPQLQGASFNYHQSTGHLPLAAIGKGIAGYTDSSTATGPRAFFVTGDIHIFSLHSDGKGFRLILLIAQLDLRPVLPITGALAIIGKGDAAYKDAPLFRYSYGVGQTGGIEDDLLTVFPPHRSAVAVARHVHSPIVDRQRRGMG